MILTIDELRADIFNRFGNTNGGDFGIVKIDSVFPLTSLVIHAIHYTTENITYKISFEKFLSYQIREEFLLEPRSEEVNYSKTFYSEILKEVDGTKYMEYLQQSTDMKVFYEGDALEKIKQYTVYTQNVSIDVIANCRPIIEIFEH